jgi:AcrR family transcriptional regulator
MAEVNRGARRYISPLRRDAAARTRQAVLDAARELFIAQGYATSTIEEIAGRAGVSKPTVFAAAGSKQAILKQLRDISLAGDDEPVPVAQRPWYREALAEPDPRRALRLYARNATAIHRRSADVHEVLRAAATSDKDLHDLWRASEDERRGGATIVVDALLQKSRLKAGLDRAAAIDIVWVLTASDIFWRLVRTRRWSDAQFESWLGDTLGEQLLPPAERHPAP